MTKCGFYCILGIYFNDYPRGSYGTVGKELPDEGWQIGVDLLSQWWAWKTDS